MKRLIRYEIRIESGIINSMHVVPTKLGGIILIVEEEGFAQFT